MSIVLRSGSTRNHTVRCQMPCAGWSSLAWHFRLSTRGEPVFCLLEFSNRERSESDRGCCRESDRNDRCPLCAAESKVARMNPGQDSPRRVGVDHNSSDSQTVSWSRIDRWSAGVQRSNRRRGSNSSQTRSRSARNTFCNLLVSPGSSGSRM